MDLNYIENSAGGPDLPLALLPQSGKVILLQLDSKLPLEMFEKVMKLAEQGCRAIHGVLINEVEKYSMGKKKNRIFRRNILKEEQFSSPKYRTSAK